MYVCHCRAVTDCRIREVIAAGAASLGEAARRSGAGVTCGGCLPMVARLLEEQGHPVPSRRLRGQAAPASRPSRTAPGLQPQSA
jgi:bacterioferritin-associated ferredoxin